MKSLQHLCSVFVVPVLGSFGVNFRQNDKCARAGRVQYIIQQFLKLSSLEFVSGGGDGYGNDGEHLLLWRQYACWKYVVGVLE